MGKSLSALFVVLFLSACGFQLRGSANLPFESLYIENAGPDMGVELARAVRASRTRVAESPEEAEAVLQILAQSRDKQILSLSGAGRVSEYRLILRTSFRVRGRNGQELLPTQTIESQREITYDASRALAKESEEALLFRDMQSDAVTQILRRLSALRAGPR